MVGKTGPRVALLGCGYWGKNLARVFHQLGSLAVICDATKEGRATATKVAPGIEVASEPDGDWSNAIDAVVIATPAETHHQLALQFLKAGKDVFVEKPLAIRYEDGSELVRHAEAKQRILMVGHLLEYHPAIEKIHEMIQGGLLGDIYHVVSHRLNLGKIRNEENVLWSFAPHDIAVTLRLIGATPVRVQACGGAHLQTNIADSTVVHMHFANGAGADLFVSWLHPFKEQRLVVIGSLRSVLFDDVAKKLVLYDQRVEWHGGKPIPIRGTEAEVAFSAAEPLRLECEAFLASIRSREPPLTGGRSALSVLRVLQAAQQSLDTNGASIELTAEAAS